MVAKWLGPGDDHHQQQQRTGTLRASGGEWACVAFLRTESREGALRVLASAISVAGCYLEAAWYCGLAIAMRYRARPLSSRHGGSGWFRSPRVPPTAQTGLLRRSHSVRRIETERSGDGCRTALEEAPPSETVSWEDQRGQISTTQRDRGRLRSKMAMIVNCKRWRLPAAAFDEDSEKKVLRKRSREKQADVAGHRDDQQADCRP